MRGAIVRAKWFDAVARAFVYAEQDGLIVSIDSGLDTRASRIALRPNIDWIDIDLPEVVALRKAIVLPLPHVRSVAADGADVAAWAQAIPWRAGHPVLVLAEEVSMYFKPSHAENWIRALVAEAQCKRSMLMLALDLASPFLVKHGHHNPSVSKTGVRFAWGIGDPADLTRLNGDLGSAPDLRCRPPVRRDVLGRGRMHWLLTGRSIYHL
ncbi:MAG: hypothetical protein CBARDMAM_6126 [uncultured Caballeronia sp.]|nr:MAG: hypothetical protein CBARDMAM_6126 [uncultured Caballeronia sp.]